MPNRWRDRMNQALKDLAHAEDSNEAGRHERACLAAQQAAGRGGKGPAPPCRPGGLGPRGRYERSSARTCSPLSDGPASDPEARIFPYDDWAAAEALRFADDLRCIRRWTLTAVGRPMDPELWLAAHASVERGAKETCRPLVPVSGIDAGGGTASSLGGARPSSSRALW